MDPWSKEDYSRNIREALMMVEKLPEVNHPSVRVPRQDRLAVPILESRWRRNRGRYHEKGSVLRVSGRSVNIGRRGAPGGGPYPQVPYWRGQEGGRASWPPGWGLAPLWASLIDSGSFRHADFLYILLEFLELCKYG